MLTVIVVCSDMAVHNGDRQSFLARFLQVCLEFLFVLTNALVGGVVHAKPAHAPLLMPFALRRDEGIGAKRRLPTDEGLLVAVAPQIVFRLP